MANASAALSLSMANRPTAGLQYFMILDLVCLDVGMDANCCVRNILTQVCGMTQLLTCVLVKRFKLPDIWTSSPENLVHLCGLMQRNFHAIGPEIAAVSLYLRQGQVNVWSPPGRLAERYLAPPNLASALIYLGTRNLNPSSVFPHDPHRCRNIDALEESPPPAGPQQRTSRRGNVS